MMVSNYLGIGMLYFRQHKRLNNYLIKFWIVAIVQIMVLFMGTDIGNL